MRIFYIKQMNMVSIARPTSGELSELKDSAQAAARLLKLLASEPRLLLLCRLVEGRPR